MRNFPILYTASDFALQGASDTYDNGVGMLSDVISTKVTEELNGIYEFEFKYPITGVHYKDIQLNNVVMVKANLRDQTQPFRIYKIERPINGIVTVSAQHISYDLNGIPVMPFASVDCVSTMESINVYSTQWTRHNFVFKTDKATAANYVLKVPASVRSILGGSEGSILDVFGGHYHFDRYTVSLLKDRGIDQGLSIRYGKNLSDITDEYDASQVYTAILPYWQYSDSDDERNNYTIVGSIVKVDSDIVGDLRIKPVDFTEEFENPPTNEQLVKVASKYARENGIEVPARNIKISYMDDPNIMNELGLGDPVNIYYTKLGVNSTSRCVKVVFNPMQNRNESVEFGELRSNIANTIVDINTAIDEDRKNQILESREITKKITERLNGFQISLNSKANSSEVDMAIDKLEASVTASEIANQIKSVVAEMTAEEFRVFFNTIKTEIENAGGEIKTYVTTIQKYIKAIDGAMVFGIQEGNDNSAIKLKLMNNQIFFFTGDDNTTNLDNAFAYMTNNVFYVDRMNAATSVQIGNSDTVNFLWVKRGNGHLSLRRQ